MKAARRIMIASLLFGVATRCRWPWEPESVLIRGTVRYVDGRRAVGAKVELQNGTSGFTDWAGRYSLHSFSTRGDTVRVIAYDFCPEACSDTHAGQTKIILRASVMDVNIVLDETIDI